jgi:hypothetical protein
MKGTREATGVTKSMTTIVILTTHGMYWLYGGKKEISAGHFQSHSLNAKEYLSELHTHECC